MGYFLCGEQQLERFNAATAVKPWRNSQAWRTSALGSMLQCGHGGEAVEKSIPVKVYSLSLASMRPRR